jgi:hypothetical protein
VSSAAPVTAPREPLIWLLLADKQGDNRQVLSLAAGLPWPWLRKQVLPRARFVLGKPFFRPSIAHLDPERSDPLQPPWPDVILTIGRRPTMAALWVRRKSGGRTRIVLVGRQPRYLDAFALVIASCQYLTANDPRILRIALPLDDGAHAAPAVVGGGAPRPGDSLALLVGGPTRTFRLEPHDALAMLRQVSALAAGAPLRVLSSRRTPPAVCAALRAALPAGARFLPWQPGGPTTSDYAAALQECSHFAVTGDSISMVCDVVRQGKPLVIVRLPFRNALVAWWHESLRKVAPQDGTSAPGAFTRLLRRLLDARVLRLPRSFDAFYDFLYRHRSAAEIGRGFLESYCYLPEQDLETARRRTREVIAATIAEPGLRQSP